MRSLDGITDSMAMSLSKLWEMVKNRENGLAAVHGVTECLENPRDGRAWWAAVYGVAQSRT